MVFLLIPAPMTSEAWLRHHKFLYSFQPKFQLMASYHIREKDPSRKLENHACVQLKSIGRLTKPLHPGQFRLLLSKMGVQTLHLDGEC